MSVVVRRHPHLYEINTWPWLDAQSRRAGRTITLATVEDEQWNRLRDRGIDIIYLMGIWQRSRLGRELARANPALFGAYDEAVPAWRARDVVGSAFCIADYVPDRAIGSWDALDLIRSKLHERGMRLIVDFVPNHTAFDHPWITSHVDRYVSAPEEVFRRSPAAFRPIELATGEVRFIACARDPFFPPWTDVAQLNYAARETRAAMVDVLRLIARHADGARCDMAMLVLSDVFTRTWGDLTGAVPADDFWREAVAAAPDFLLLAEVYWNLEGRLQQLGFQFTYDKVLYDRLLHGSGEAVRAHLTADAESQSRCVRFIENHDEPRSVTVFGDRVIAAAVAMSTLPGLRFYYDGQFEGHRARVPVQLGRFADEPVDARLAALYDRLLPTADQSIFHAGTWSSCDVAAVDETTRHLVAWQWKLDDDLRIVVINCGATTAHGLVDVQSALPSDNGGLRFTDALDGGRYERSPYDLQRGLYVRLGPGQAHVFSVNRLA